MAFRSVSRCLRSPATQSIFASSSAQQFSAAPGQVASTAPEVPIFGSCILSRAPVVKPLPEDWEVEYKQWAEKFRIRREEALPKEWQRTSKAEDEEDEAEVATSASHWREAPRITDADKTGDTKSLMRWLDRYLYFVVKTSSGRWSFPATAHRAGETIRQTGERALAECIDANADTFFIANWPMAHCAFDESPRVEFYVKAQLLTGRVSLQSGTEFVDYAWIAKSELEKYLEEGRFASLMEKALQ